MSNFPDWWDKKITIYNKFTDTSTRVVTWYKTTIDKPTCFWKEVGDKTVVGNVTVDTKSIIVRIPQSSKYATPQEWWGLTDKSAKFTLQQDDIIVLGVCEDVINEYEAGKHSTDLLTKYKRFGGIMEIKQVANDTMSGMLFKHYLVKGL